MLSQKELSILYEIISNKNQTFEKISEVFNANFKEESKIKAATTLSILLEDNLLNIHQRIISYYILYDISKWEKMEINPFLSVILEKLRSSTEENEQNFLIDYLCKQINYLNMTIDKYLSNKKKEQRINMIQIQMHWDKYYKEMLKQKNINVNKNDKIWPMIYDRKKVDIKYIDNHPNNYLLAYVNNGNEFNLNYLKTDYLNYCPANSGFIANEPIWLLPALKHNYLWDKK